MTPARYIICSSCSDGTRHAYWQGICPTSGRSAWTRDPRAAVAFAEFGHALAFAGACIEVGTAPPEQYDVVDLHDVAELHDVSELRQLGGGPNAS